MPKYCSECGVELFNENIKHCTKCGAEVLGKQVVVKYKVHLYINTNYRHGKKTVYA